MSIETPLSLFNCSGGSPGFTMYTVPDNGNMDTYVMQGTEMNQHLHNPAVENIEAMTSDGMSEFVVDTGLYYPAATGYGYYCTGFESPSEWDDHHAVFGLDGADVQYAGAQTENMPYVYYTPSYGYGDAAFNPYNPYIPGAMIGVDGQYVGAQPYYTVSPYQNSVSSPGYFPVLVSSGPDAVASSSTETLLDVGASATHGANGSIAKGIYSSTPTTLPVNSSKTASSQVQSLNGAPQRINPGTSKRLVNNRTNSSGGSVHGASSHMPQNGNASTSLPSTRNISYGKLLPQSNQVNYSYPVGNGISEYGPGTNGQVVLNDPWSKFYYKRASNDGNGNHDQLGEQNRGPRINKSKNQFVVRAYTTKAGQVNSEGNIVISADQYNKDDFPVDFVSAKFFVIKSYSEDDVHKSIKYNVWSSTPNGNKKLNSAYEDAQKIAAGKPRGCPVFLFFSVNASGQFCGVAEMLGAVDFDNDMDFWQQDKWSGSFPVKWHFIKDVPNPSFRHIILENNEHKPVTNSRDTQEIMFKQGMEMLRIYKNYTPKTSLLDDFIYYENRQKIMYEERARLLRKANVFVHAAKPPIKLTALPDHPSKNNEMGIQIEKSSHPKIPSGHEKISESVTATIKPSSIVEGDNVDTSSGKQNSSGERYGDVDISSTLNIGSLSIQPKSEPALSVSAAAKQKPDVASDKVVTVGSMPIKVDGVSRSSGMITIGTIPLDPKALKNGKVGGFSKSGLQN